MASAPAKLLKGPRGHRGLRRGQARNGAPEEALGRMTSGELFLPLLLLLFLSHGAAGAPGTLVGMGSRRPQKAPATTWSFPRRKREEKTPSYLQWVAFEGQLPPDAISNWNAFSQRMEYICSTEERGCNTGAYSPERGPYCFYPYNGCEEKTQTFKLLVNVGGFEALAWVEESFGSIPKDAVEGCPAVDVFVGRNQRGLGKISREQRAFFVVEEQEEVWYKWYQALVVKKGWADVTISEVHYNMSRAVESKEKVTLKKSVVRNEGCQRVKKVLSLEEATELEQEWAMDQKLFSTIHGALRAAPLLFNGSGWEVTNITTLPWVGGASISQYIVHQHLVEKEIPGHMACLVTMEGQQLELQVPFSALLTRDFGAGERHRLVATGWTRSKGVADVQVGVKECWVLTDVPPC